jgi:bifunctional DNA-binding transcriptional regulator/antitoxin component of YhaV-PrlF toxin-antitoxin module
LNEIVVNLEANAQVTIPIQVQRTLHLNTPGYVAFVIEGDSVRLHRSASPVERLFGSIPALPNESADLRREIDEAMQVEMDARYPPL